MTSHSRLKNFLLETLQNEVVHRGSPWNGSMKGSGPGPQWWSMDLGCIFCIRPNLGYPVHRVFIFQRHLEFAHLGFDTSYRAPRDYLYRVNLHQHADFWRGTFLSNNL